MKLSVRFTLVNVFILPFILAAKINKVKLEGYDDWFNSGLICRYFGGSCGICEQYYRHSWGLSLCPGDLKCCAPPGVGGSPSRTTAPSSNPATTTTTPTTTTTTPQPTSTRNTDDDDDPGQCGITTTATRRKRIVGGFVSRPGSWPWLVNLRAMLGYNVCGGAVIARRWVVTAAHCFKQFSYPRLWRVRVGEYDIHHHDTNERNVAITEIYIHPNYQSGPVMEHTTSENGSRNGTRNAYAKYRHDIALLHLAEDAEVMPVCLPEAEINDNASSNQTSENITSSSSGSDPSQSDPPSHMERIETNGDCWVTGWGLTSDNSTVMREVHADLVDHQTCGQMWHTHLDDDMICFGDGVHGPCLGDSGGPLSCRHGGKFYLVGVVSWGTEKCDVSGYPSVFTRIKTYHDWILSVVGAGNLPR